MPIIRSFKGKEPQIDPESWIAENVVLTGDIEIGARCNLWYGVVARADVNSIRIGSGSNIQDQCVIHVNGTPSHPTEIGQNVTVGHAAIIHGATIEDECLIGMGSILLNGCYIEKHCIVAAGAVVKEGFRVPEGHLIAGVPGKIIRELTEEELGKLPHFAKHYWDDIVPGYR